MLGVSIDTSSCTPDHFTTTTKLYLHARQIAQLFQLVCLQLQNYAVHTTHDRCARSFVFNINQERRNQSLNICEKNNPS